MERDRVLVGVRERRHRLVGPPVRDQPPRPPGVARPEPVDARDPDDVGIARIDRDDVHVPAHVAEGVVRAHPALDEHRRHGVGQQQSMQLQRIRLRHLRRPTARLAGAIRPIERVQALLARAIGSALVAGGQRIDHVGTRGGDRQRRPTHPRFTKHRLDAWRAARVGQPVDRRLLERSARHVQHVVGAIAADLEVEAAAANGRIDQTCPGRAGVERTPESRARRGVETPAVAVADNEVVDPVEVVRCGRREERPGCAAIRRGVDPRAAQRQAGAPHLFTKVPFAGAKVHDVWRRGRKRQGIDRDVGHRVAHRPPMLPRIVAAPQPARDSARKDDLRAGRMDGQHARSSADVAGTERRPCPDGGQVSGTLPSRGG